jgi:hypothetical protein
VPLVVATLPVSEVAVQRGEQLHATDGWIGEVEGLIVDAATRHVSTSCSRRLTSSAARRSPFPSRLSHQ